MRIVEGFRLAARGAAVSARVLRHGAALGGRALLCRLRGRPLPERAVGEALAALFEALGPAYIKVGQILSARPDLLPPGVVLPLARLQDDLRPERGDARALAAAALGRPPEEVFASFDPAPLACGSIAQVHRATLRGGREVAVKLRRPGVAARVERDLRLLEAVAGAVGRLPGMAAMPVAEVVREIAGPIRQQTDFRREAENARRFRAHFAGAEQVEIPALVEELCSDAVLVLEHVGDARRVTSAGLEGEAARTAALAGLHALYRMIFVHGFIHADLHPGNVFVRPWGGVVLLDFGLVAELTGGDQRDYVDFFFGLANNQGAECARILWDTAAARPAGCDRAAFGRAVEALIDRHASLRSEEFEITRFVYQLMELQRRFRIRGSTRFIMTVLSMVVFDGICKQLHPRCDFQREARGYLVAARYRRAPAAA